MNARAEAISYYQLCDKAASLGIPVSLDDPRSPRTVAGLREAVAAAEPIAAMFPASVALAKVAERVKRP